MRSQRAGGPDMYLGIDLGTQSVKALLYDADRRCVEAVHAAPLDMTSSDDGTREQHADDWLEALQGCLGQFTPAQRSGVRALAVAGQQHGFVPLDAAGDVLAPVKLWCDTATTAQCAEITAAFGGARQCIEAVGNPILPGYTAPKIRWLKQRHPDLYRRLHTVLLPHDYLNFYLTGERVMECGDASGTGLLDIRKRAWHAGMLRAVDPERDLSECLPPLVPPGAMIGSLLAQAASELGLRAGLPVSAGGGDNMLAAIGTGTVSPGRIAVSLGTSGTLFASSDTPVVDSEGILAAFCSSTDGWLPLVCSMNCTVATELTRALLGTGLASLDARLAQSPPGAQGVLTLPFFNGERTPNLPRARGCIVGLQANNYSADNLLRSALEGAMYGLRMGLERLTQLGGAAHHIRLTGGGAA
ncbi:MAG: xylulokinase, partial [Halioglobus sp.]|nr:xylulokinase [Halioglobus sp.]